MDQETDFIMSPRPFVNPMIKVKKEEKEDYGTLELEQEEEEEEEEETNHQTLELNQSQTNQQEKEAKQRKQGKSKTVSFKQREYVQSRRVPKGSNMKPLVAQNRQRLSQILRDLAGVHQWKDASGVLSVLLAGATRGTSLREDRCHFLVAVEILKKFGDKSRFEAQMKKLFEVWMGKLNWLKKSNDKKTMVMLELALFYISQGNIQEAYNLTNLLIQDKSVTKNTPTLMLLHGLISYHIWYTTNIPKEMQIKDFDFYVQSEIKNPISDGFKEGENVLESSNDHNALDIEDPGFASESSVCNNNENVMNGNENPRKQMKDFGKRNAGFYVNESLERDNNCSPPSLANLESTSIFLAHGLDVSLLPIKLKIMHGDLRNCIESYRKLVNEMYNCAVQNLRGALHSNPPLIPALLPLVQLLLLGDHVKEAADELEKCCLVYKTALCFRLRAKLFESFAKGQTIIISLCCEEVLKRDPTCFYSIRSLIRLHKNGDYNTINYLEMIATHLDTVDGRPIIWEELALYFLNLVNVNANTSDYEDGVSILSSKLCSKKVPEVFAHGRTRGTWRIRHRWWMNLHFSEKNLLSETQIGDHKLLTRKAACACHMYGPEFEYVMTVYEMLKKQRLNDEISFLRVHMQNPMCEFLNLSS